MGKFFDPDTALSYAWIVFRDGTSTNRASVTKWDRYSLQYGAMKLKRYIMRSFNESQIQKVILFDNKTRKEIDRMIPFTDSWNDHYPPKQMTKDGTRPPASPIY
ncbi:hypothetical protein [Marinilabilia rubra]|uniref:Uncharacterized protein n=1 Tax=Marinilabilia rubra TaxID=2162893 RepID=A0A2U2B6Y3_9BACT|nr:hypothetical protein [Marinilabilia rubra]PWD98815.1 hypothetical protein DDZ16_13835 [Marinilabilia rubra]